jgi:cyclophilin family peptidyl-prolyl cis-trans isomerase
MSPKNIWISIILAIIVITGAWFFLDHRSGYPKGPDELMGIYTSQTASTSPADSNTAATQSPTAVASNNQSSPTTSQSSVKNFMHTITIDTNKGAIVFETYDADAPKTVANFVSLADKGFYNGLIFHRVIEGFMIQGGDPTGIGTGGPGYQFADELNPATDSYKAGYVRGTVAMANSGPDTNGSQFFIMQQAINPPLQHNYSIFGKVISGMDVVDAIAAVPVDSPTHNKPLTNVVMTKVTVGEVK